MKASIHCLAACISNIVNCSIITGICPDQLKIAKAYAVYKSERNEQFTNYRPISVLSSFSKIFEKVTFNRLSGFLCKNKSLSECQYGFRQNRSTDMAILDIYNKISAAVDQANFQ